MGTVWVVILAVAAAQLRRFFEQQPRAQAWIARTMGGAVRLPGRPARARRQVSLQRDRLLWQNALTRDFYTMAVR